MVTIHESLSLFGDGVAGPIVDASEFVDIGIAHGSEFLGCFFASSAATTVDKNCLVLVREQLIEVIFCFDVLVGDADGIGNMFFCILVFSSDI